ncbi:isochorismate synthase DhbC [Cytobacillus horneckiae]|uniref:isochorismate synthase DhbC n=1 Tax=Cytobacillus horneckiae TaxID=549687 RepID=UPI003D21F0CB
MAVSIKNKEYQLLDKFNAGDNLLYFPSKCILGKGEAVSLSAEEQSGLSFSERIHTLFRKAEVLGKDEPIIIGGLPFNKGNRGMLIVPESVEQQVDMDSKQAGYTASSLSIKNIQSIPFAADYEKAVEKIVSSIQNGELEKAVLGRILQVAAKEELNIPQLIKQLIAENENKFNFALNISDGTERKKTLIGASPELLISKYGKTVVTNPLAGSRPRKADPLEDRQMENELRHSKKDLHEHQFVVHSIEEALRPFCKSLYVPKKPSVISTNTMWHLSTKIVGELKDSSTQSIQLAECLHPTPAICGTPADTAYKKIEMLEPFERDYFTGLIGWSNRNGDGEWAITIRCAEIENNLISLFAGAGIVEDSVPQEETAETAAKFRTMLSALGIKNIEEEGHKQC